MPSLHPHRVSRTTAVALVGLACIALRSVAMADALPAIYDAGRQAVMKQWEGLPVQIAATPTTTVSHVPCDGVAVGTAHMAGSRAWPIARELAIVPLLCPDGEARTVPVWFAVHANGQALVAAQALNGGTEVSVDQVRLENLDLALAGKDPLVDPSQLRGMRTRHPLATGETLAKDDFEPLPTIVQGHGLLARAEAGAIRIETAVVAEQDGNPGDVIRVRRSDSGDRLRVRIVDSSVGEVVAP